MHSHKKGYELIADSKDKDKIIAVKVNGILKDLNIEVCDSDKVEFVLSNSKEGLEILRHSTSHLMAQAVKQLFPHVKLAIGPAIEDGFYYDFERDEPFTPEDIKKIEEKMNENLRKDQKFERFEVSKADALKKFADEPYKKEMIEEIHDEKITIYKNGDFEDFCRGPHVPSTKYLKGFKLMKSAGAYWRGDPTKKQLQRIYGISFPTKEEVKAHLKMLEEAEKRDHRKIGQDLDLIYFHEYAPGAPFYLKKGAIIYNILIDFIRKEYKKRGYQEVITPQLYNKKLWETSGHWEHYKENMFIVNIEGQEHSLKPMNCPSHCLIYNRDVKSYKDLPIRIADFCNLHRNELSGTLSGMFRVRKFAQDDGHTFCRFDQIEEEVIAVLEFIKYVWIDIFGFKLEYYLSTMPDKALGSKETWEKAEHYLANALEKANIEYKIKPKEGAFYGPKIDIDIEDALGRKWQCPTCQLDFNLPERFQTMYMDAESKKQPCVMIHRAVLGSLERFFGVMTEHYAGKFPLWLSPIQVRILTVADRFNEHALGIKKKMEDADIRVDVDFKSESIPKKVREAQLQKIPLMITIGEKEEAANTLAVRTLDGKIKFGVKVDEFIAAVKENVEKREIKFAV